jgi:hypothetical protein
MSTQKPFPKATSDSGFRQVNTYVQVSPSLAYSFHDIIGTSTIEESI